MRASRRHGVEHQRARWKRVSNSVPHWSQTRVYKRDWSVGFAGRWGRSFETQAWESRVACDLNVRLQPVHGNDEAAIRARRFASQRAAFVLAADAAQNSQQYLTTG